MYAWYIVTTLIQSNIRTHVLLFTRITISPLGRDTRLSHPPKMLARIRTRTYSSECNLGRQEPIKFLNAGYKFTRTDLDCTVYSGLNIYMKSIRDISNKFTICPPKHDGSSQNTYIHILFIHKIHITKYMYTIYLPWQPWTKTRVGML